MRPTLEVYVNGDDALLRWTADELDPACRGFAVQRRAQRRRAGAGSTTSRRPARRPPDAAAHQRSDAWPFRAFTWTDHAVERGRHGPATASSR